MTNPVILFGTQSNGETLPVQVDATGRLVAEGLQGQQGPPGQEGPPGAPGGSFPLPPDPYEGALLGWLNGGLSWIGSPPIPIPPGVFGPIVSWNPQTGVLTVDGEIPEAVGNAVYIWQCEADRTYFTEGWNTSQTFSNGFPSDQATQSPTIAFNGDITSGGVAYNNQNNKNTLWNPPDSVKTGVSKLEVLLLPLDGGNDSFTVNTPGAVNGPLTVVNGNQWFEIPLSGNTFGTITITPGTGGYATLKAIKVNNQLLVDTAESLNMRVQQVSPPAIVGGPNHPVDFTLGKYLYVPEQRVAPWVYLGNDPTSLIDYLRQT